uniref:Uncharacterized protein n=1 Tax=Eutreptiella gymnastica TaxID=73025 RepID=A0A6U8EKN1_9EUGL
MKERGHWILLHEGDDTPLVQHRREDGFGEPPSAIHLNFRIFGGGVKHAPDPTQSVSEPVARAGANFAFGLPMLATSQTKDCEKRRKPTKCRRFAPGRTRRRAISMRATPLHTRVSSHHALRHRQAATR